MSAMNNGTLMMAAASLDDLEHTRKAVSNRFGFLTRTGADKDGVERGLGLDERHPDVALAAEMLEDLKAVEKKQIKNLEKVMKKHPLGDFVKNTKGLGFKTIGRLIAATGDPYWADRVTKTSDGKIVSIDSGPRTKREFFAYCGYGIAPGGGRAVRREKGQRSNWNAEAKKRAYIVAEPIIKNGGPYREVYDAARAKYDLAVHTVECVRCGPAGKPALPGSPLSNGHQHARAIRAVSKAVLGDLYDAAKEWHEQNN